MECLSIYMLKKNL